MEVLEKELAKPYAVRVGDLIEIDGVIQDVLPQTIADLSYNDLKAYYIDLTPEILEKIGFEKCESLEDGTRMADYQYSFERDVCYVSFDDNNLVVSIASESAFEFGTWDFKYFEIYYLHELQQLYELSTGMFNPFQDCFND